MASSNPREANYIELSLRDSTVLIHVCVADVGMEEMYAREVLAVILFPV